MTLLNVSSKFALLTPRCHWHRTPLVSCINDTAHRRSGVSLTLIINGQQIHWFHPPLVSGVIDTTHHWSAISLTPPVLQSWSRKELHHFGDAGAVMWWSSGSKSDVQHGFIIKNVPNYDNYLLLTSVLDKFKSEIRINICRNPRVNFSLFWRSWLLSLRCHWHHWPLVDVKVTARFVFEFVFFYI
jgi:hypothetical protein